MPNNQTDTKPNQILAVDLDGTLIAGDIGLLSSMLHLRRPLGIIQVLYWLISGGTLRVKNEVAKHCCPAMDSLIWHNEVIDFVKEKSNAGYLVVLATAAAKQHAEAVAKKLGLFTDILHSSDKINLYGSLKADALDKDYGQGNWEYVGDSPSQDPNVFARARSSHMVGNHPTLGATAKQLGRVFATQRNGLFTTLRKIVRPHELFANLLVLLPIIFLPISNFKIGLVAPLGLALLAFSFVTYGTKLIGTLFELPYAANSQQLAATLLLQLGVRPGVRAGLLLLVLGLACSIALPIGFTVWLVGFILLNACYRLWLAQPKLVRIIGVASLDLFRLLAGVALINVEYMPTILVGAWVLLLIPHALANRKH